MVNKASASKCRASIRVANFVGIKPCWLCLVMALTRFGMQFDCILNTVQILWMHCKSFYVVHSRYTIYTYCIHYLYDTQVNCDSNQSIQYGHSLIDGQTKVLNISNGMVVMCDWQPNMFCWFLHIHGTSKVEIYCHW